MNIEELKKTILKELSPDTITTDYKLDYNNVTILDDPITTDYNNVTILEEKEYFTSKGYLTDVTISIGCGYNTFTFKRKEWNEFKKDKTNKIPIKEFENCKLTML